MQNTINRYNKGVEQSILVVPFYLRKITFQKIEEDTNMLRTDLPEIITETLPGPKAQAIIDRREAVNPSAIKCIYPVVIERVKEL